MGQSHSTQQDEEVEDFTTYLSEQELKILDAIIDKSNSFSSQLSRLQDHVSKSLPSHVAKGVVLLLKTRCSNQPTSERVKQEICKLIFGYQIARIGFVYDVLSTGKGEVSKSSITEFVKAILLCVQSHVTSSIFGFLENSSNNFCDSVLSCNETLNNDEFTALIVNSHVLAKLLDVGTRYIFLNTFFATNADGSIPTLLPQIETLPHQSLFPLNTLLHTSDVIYLNSKLPTLLQAKWRLLYSTRLQGESFSKLSSQVINKGPLLFVVKDQGGNVFGGFVSTNLTYSSKFQGNHESFVFSVIPKLDVFAASGYNDHYVYFNIRQETMPNGFGMGGQHGYFGMWLSAEFGKGHSKAKPTCTTYKSPQLSTTDEFSIDTVEVWGLGEEPTDEKEQDSDEEELTSVIDKNPEAVAILQIAGKERVSEGYRESERSSTMPETTQLHPPNDPME